MMGCFCTVHLNVDFQTNYFLNLHIRNDHACYVCFFETDTILVYFIFSLETGSVGSALHKMKLAWRNQSNKHYFKWDRVEILFTFPNSVSNAALVLVLCKTFWDYIAVNSSSPAST